MARCIVLSFVVTICLCGLSTAQPNPPAPKQLRTTAKSTFPEFPPLQLGDVKKLPKIRQLQVERYKAAQEMKRIVDQQWRVGGRGIMPGTVYKTGLLLMESRLDLAESDAEKIRILEVGVAIAKRIEMEANLKAKFGGNAGFTLVDTSRARYERLSMEIRLERAKAKLKLKQARPKTSPRL
jgi:hypothetical protein